MSGTLDFLEVATRQTIADMMARHRAELAPHLKVLADITAIRQPEPQFTVAERLCAGIDWTLQCR